MIQIMLGVLMLQLPPSFDLRDVGGENYVTSVKSQQGGTCWTHGTMASIESNMLITGEWEDQGETGEPALAEYHLDWWNGFNDWYNADMDPPYGSGGLTPHQGGDYLVATAYLSRGDGAVREIDGQSYGVAPSLYSPDFHVYYPMEVQWHIGGDDLASLDRIKEAVMNTGALATCYYSSSTYMQNYIHYQPSSAPELPNHSVAIIGWDDDKVTQAPEPGAWICKNSWGESWGFDGFFYISYWDKWCGREPFMGAVSFTDARMIDYEAFYYHDYHGWRDTFESPQMVMNSFEATGDHYITAVSFFTAADSVDYTASMYGSFQGGSPSDLLSVETGTALFRGFHTIELSQPFQAAQGDSIHFVMEFSHGGYPYDRTADVPVLLGAAMRVIVESAASQGESWYNDGSWHDLYFWSENPYPGTGNFCLKLLGYDAGLRVTPEGDRIFQGEVGGPFEPASVTWDLSYKGGSSADYTVDPQSVSWLEVTGPLTGTIYPGDDIQITASLTPEAQNLPLGVHTAEVDFVNNTSGMGNTTATVVLIAGEAGLIYSWNMDADPGWTADAKWEWGVPQGLGGSHGNPDPTSGHTGDNVYGYNLEGDYEPSLSEKYLTTSPIDCSGLYGTQLRFQRWLGVEGNQYDHASVEISTDGDTWFSVWENGAEEITDDQWSTRIIDISQWADTSPQVWIRWVMGTTDPGWEYCGWNIDDVEIWAAGAMSVEGGAPQGVFSLGFAGANPAVSSTAFRCTVPQAGLLTLQVHDITGRVVRTLYSGEAPSGDISIPYNLTDASGRRLPPGIYPVVAFSGEHTVVSRLVVLGN
ncbi:MAG TPA: lectin like domain-containing protein [Candidatus Sabulitectum sp.]|nr:lectin like domain-containing protein [Candidatus Sabulitectum sp.]HPR22151.1 lectin like domain-containing protein [Candidatus Sabulitectum sp.]